MKVLSPTEWAKLAELPCPQIQSDRETGKIYTVTRVAVNLAPLSACAGIDTKNVPQQLGRLCFPIVETEEAGKLNEYRLPLALTQWAMDVAARAQGGLLTFPMKIEFGTLNGRSYADML